MAKITYLDPTDDAPKIEWHGVTFKAEVPKELDDELYAALIEAASTHPYFKVEGGKEPEADPAPVNPEDDPAPTGKPTWPEDDEPAHRHKAKSR
jgi:hypothetical protein